MKKVFIVMSVIIATITITMILYNIRLAQNNQGDKQNLLSGMTANGTKRITTNMLDLSYILAGKMNADDFEKETLKWKTAPTRKKIEKIPSILKCIQIDDCLHMDKYIYEEGKNDLERTSGRAAEVIEVVYGLKAGKIGPKSSKSDIAAIFDRAKELLDAYAKGAIDMSKEIYSVSKERMKEKYANKITFEVKNKDNVTKVRDGMRKMDELLKEWFPLGKKISDLEEIVGEKSDRKSKQNFAMYYFEMGMTTYRYEFQLDNDIIINIKIHGGY